MNAADNPTEAACDLRFGQVGMACVRVRRADAAAVCANLEQRVRAAPQLFERTAVVLDLSHLSQLPDDGTVDALLEAVRTAGMLPAGLAYGTRDTEALAARMNVPLIARFREAYERAGAPAAKDAPGDSAKAEIPAAPGTQHLQPQRTHLHDGPVRSGQQVYARDCDLIVHGTVANAAEAIADGCIHIYGTLRGRALAGAQGDAQARIYCTDFRAELISIAGQYRVFEDLPRKLAGKPVVCRLEGEKLHIDPM